MIYFIVTTGLLVLLAIFLAYLFFKAYAYHKERKWKKAWQYFIPTLLALALVALTAVSVGPRLFDGIDLAGGHLDIITAELEDIRFPMTAVFSNGAEYTYSPLESKLEEGKSYLVRVTPRTHIAISFELLER